MKLQWSFFPGSAATLERPVAGEDAGRLIIESRLKHPNLFLTGIDGHLPGLWLQDDSVLREALSAGEDDQSRLLTQENPELKTTPPCHLLMACAGAPGALQQHNKDFYETCGVLYASRLAAAAPGAKQPILGRRFFCLEADWPQEMASVLLHNVEERLFRPLHPHDVQKVFDDLSSRRRPVATVTFVSVYGPMLKGGFKDRKAAYERLREARLEEDTAAALSHWIMRDYAAVPKGGLGSPLTQMAMAWIQEENRSPQRFLGRDPLTGEAAPDLGPLPSVSSRLVTRTRVRAGSQAVAAAELLSRSEAKAGKLPTLSSAGLSRS